MKTKISVLVIGLLLLVACGGQFPATSEGTYAQSLTLFNDSVEAYYVILTAQKPEIKAEWKKNINPSIHAASAALDIWAAAIGTDSEIDKQMIYIKLWRGLFPMLINLGVIEIKE